jgi:hypothetical protein
MLLGVGRGVPPEVAADDATEEPLGAPPPTIAKARGVGRAVGSGVGGGGAEARLLASTSISDAGSDTSRPPVRVRRACEPRTS